MTISVPGTSANLGPGFDTLGLAVNLRNYVSIKRGRFHSVHIRGEGEDNPRLKSNHLFMGIFNEHYKKITGKRDNFHFEFNNSIPISRGLGSSSAVIVSALASAYEAANIKITKRKLLNLALVYESHPDNIAPAVMGGFNVCTIERNRVYSQKKRLPSYLRAVVVIPDKPISTSQSRHKLPSSYHKDIAVYNLSHAALLTSAFFTENWELLRVAAKDKFHQKVRMQMLNELFIVQKMAMDNGALMSTLSGSGSTFFNLCYQDDSHNLVKKLRNRFPDFLVKSLELDNDGLRIR